MIGMTSMRKFFTADLARTLRRCGAAMLFSATLAASVAGAHAGSVAEPLVSAQWLNGHLRDADLVVLDIRSAIDGSKPEAFAQGHIPGAVHSDYDKGGWRVTRNNVPFMVPTRRSLKT
jgi:thiosulfate/3-mercaptopyruvate sulfurtransferase